MNAINPFVFEDNLVRVVEVGGEPWFVGKDVATILGYTNPQKAVRDHCKGYRSLGVNESFTPHDLDSQTIMIPERDLYRLIMRSKLPAAERFEEWVVGEVLPTIRKTGRYDVQTSKMIGEFNFVVKLLAETQAELLQQKNRKIFNNHADTARLLIENTSLTDEEIADKMRDMLKEYVPEWVAYQRRKMVEEAAA